MKNHRDIQTRSNPLIKPAFWTIVCGVAYYFSNPKPQNYYDYTFRVAENILRGSIGFTEKQPSWLNEFVTLDGFYYSVFPLGSVLTMIPFALLKVLGIINGMPGSFIAAFCASIVCLLLFSISERYDISMSRRVLKSLGIIFGTWMWTNLTFVGAWQLALGFAMIGELGAIYFTVYNRKPLLAGLFFALAFGNRTEILLTAPIFLFLLVREDFQRRDAEMSEPGTVVTGVLSHAKGNPIATARGSDQAIRKLAAFCVVPFVIGVATLIYNYVRFHSFSDFGYARIPGVLQEPWYNHGIFSYQYIPRQAWEMLWRLWEWKTAFPYLVPNPFSSSILWSSPFILFALRFGSRDKVLKYASWLAIIILTTVLWMHGNSGGWQFGYRYAMVLLPWLFVILLETAPKKLSPLEWAAYIFSIAANAYATWLFHWTEYLKP